MTPRVPAIAALALLAVVLCSPSGAQTYRTSRYAARWTDDSFSLQTPGGRPLVRWPVGAASSPADATIPAAPQPAKRGRPVLAPGAGAPTLTWRWRFPAPCPFSEQAETYRLLPDRVEVRVGVRWRGRSARLLRMVYGGRLAAGCADLEGLWEEQEPAAKAGLWTWAPVPGVTRRTGQIRYRRTVQLPATDARLVLGGVDDGDVTTWDGREVGRTPSDRQALSWTKVRRYEVGASGDRHTLEVDATNVEGQGGLWRGPCVLGPAGQLDSVPARDGWTRASCSGKALHHWCPDSYAQPLRDRFTVSLTSLDRTREVVPENVTSGGRFLLSPYVVAVEGTAGWWGIGTLDLPRAEDGLRVEWRDGALSCPFLLATEPGTQPGGWTWGPRVALLTGTSKASVLRTYLTALAPRSPSPRQDWWSGPEYCTWGDQEYARRLGGRSDQGSLTDDRVREWLHALAERRIEAPLVVLDAGWWQLSRQLIRELHAERRHVAVWTQPHWGPDTSRHSEWAMRDAIGRPITYDPNNWILDYTSAAVRARIGADMRSYVAANGWGADGIKLDFPYTASPVWAVHADPSWGAGEQYRARVLRFIYRAIKSGKRDALVTCVCANPLFGPVQDVCRLNDDWTGDPETYRRRAAVALAVGEWANCDDWYAYESSLARQAVERPVWGTFTLMSALYRGDARNRPVPLSPAWAARLSAIMRLARLAPVRAGQRCVYDPDRNTARRVDARGGLVAAALPLVGGRAAQALAVMSSGRLYVTAIASGRLALPVSGTDVRVVAVRHDGTRSSAAVTRAGDRSLLNVEDAAGRVAWYEVAMRTQGRKR